MFLKWDPALKLDFSRFEQNGSRDTLLFRKSERIFQYNPVRIEKERNLKSLELLWEVHKSDELSLSPARENAGAAPPASCSSIVRAQRGSRQKKDLIF
jgi:hypothetical protein